MREHITKCKVANFTVVIWPGSFFCGEFLPVILAFACKA
jgi:hypothetical protein